MKCWKVTGPCQLTLVEQTPALGDDKVKIKVNRIGLSHSDVDCFERGTQYVIGRQCVGMISEVGANVSEFSRGNRVIVDPYVRCDGCENCRTERFGDCQQMLIAGFDTDGFAADFVNVCAKYVYQLPDNVKDADAVFVEHIAIAINTFAKLRTNKGEHMVIIGSGLLGLVLAQLALYYQVVPILIDTERAKLDIASRLGVYYTLNPAESDPLKKIISLTGGRGAENIVYLGGSGLDFAQSTSLVMRGGEIAILGMATNYGQSLGSIDPLLAKQLTLVGVNNGCNCYPAAINMLANKSVVIPPAIYDEIEFDQIDTIMAQMHADPLRYTKIVAKR